MCYYSQAPFSNCNILLLIYYWYSILLSYCDNLLYNVGIPQTRSMQQHHYKSSVEPPCCLFIRCHGNCQLPIIHWFSLLKNNLKKSNMYSKKSICYHMLFFICSQSSECYEESLKSISQSDSGNWGRLGYREKILAFIVFLSRLHCTV